MSVWERMVSFGILWTYLRENPWVSTVLRTLLPKMCQLFAWVCVLIIELRIFVQWCTKRQFELSHRRTCRTCSHAFCHSLTLLKMAKLTSWYFFNLSSSFSKASRVLSSTVSLWKGWNFAFWIYSGMVTKPIPFCWLFTFKDRCQKGCFQQTHNQGSGQLLLTVSLDLRA